MHWLLGSFLNHLGNPRPVIIDAGVFSFVGTCDTYSTRTTRMQLSDHAACSLLLDLQMPQLTLTRDHATRAAQPHLHSQTQAVPPQQRNAVCPG